MPSLTATAAPGRAGQVLRRSLRRHGWFLGAIALYALAGQLVPRIFGLEDYIRLSLYLASLWTVLLCFGIAFVLGHPIYVMVVKRPEGLVAHLLRDYRERFLKPERFANGLLVIAALPIFLSVFTSFKIMIPRIAPFSWDPLFAAWDEALHFGFAPWELLQPLLGFPAATVAINFAYHLWFFVLYGLLLWQAFTLEKPRVRMQYLLSTVATWTLLGSLAATLLSSAGPVYYGRVVAGPDPFAPLMDYLRATGETHFVPALFVQDLLWEDYLAGGVSQARGISAMPSMHVSSAFLFVLLAWQHGRVLRWALGIFFGLILIGSVHLGWHYAIDGYLAIPLTWLIWRLCGRLLDLDPEFRRELS